MIVGISFTDTGYVLAQEKPNILFILADDMGYGGLNCYGNELIESPNIDKLCSEGMKFTNGYAPAAECAPARATIISGQYAPRNGIYVVVDRAKGKEKYLKYIPPYNDEGMDTAKFSLAKALRSGGYATAMYGKWHLGKGEKYHPVHSGFDEAIVSSRCHYNFKTEPKMDIPEGAYVGDFMTDKALDFITRKVNEKTPFFVYMPYFLIHAPLETKPGHLEHFKKILPDSIKKVKKHLEWYAMTKSLDENVGRLLDKLAELGVDDNTLVVFTSDNGSPISSLNTFNGGLRSGKGQVYEGGIRVPFIFKWPGIVKPGTISHESINGVDIYPTLLEAANVEFSKDYEIDGTSFIPVLKSDGSAKLGDRPIIWFYPKYAKYKEDKGIWEDIWRNVIIEGDYKLIEYVDYNSYELFNLKEDRNEENELSETMPDKVMDLKKKLEKWKKDINAAEPIVNENYIN